MSKHICLYGFMVLLIASVGLQFLRVKLRRRIVTLSGPVIREAGIGIEWANAEQGLGMVLGDSRKMKLVRKHSVLLPAEISDLLKRFTWLSSIELTVTLAMLLFALFAYQICFN